MFLGDFGPPTPEYDEWLENRHFENSLGSDPEVYLESAFAKA